MARPNIGSMTIDRAKIVLCATLCLGCLGATQARGAVVTIPVLVDGTATDNPLGSGADVLDTAGSVDARLFAGSENHGLLQFNMSSITSGSMIQGALLKLNATLVNSLGPDFKAEVGVRGFVGNGTLSLSNADTGPPSFIGGAFVTTTGNVFMNVPSSFLQQFVGSSNRAGFDLRAVNASEGAIFDSLESVGGQPAQLLVSLVEQLTLHPAVDGYATDSPINGVFDQLNTTAPSLSTSFSTVLNTEERALAEYNLANIPSTVTITGAKLEVTVTGWGGVVGVPNTLEVYGYAGNGALSTSDATAPATLVGSVQVPEITSLDPITIPIDPAFIKSLLGTGNFAGFYLRNPVNGQHISVASNESTLASEPLLILSIPEPPGLVIAGIGMAVVGLAIHVKARKRSCHAAAR